MRTASLSIRQEDGRRRGGWAAARRIASGYRPGSTVACYVNPRDADEATLNRELSIVWLVGLMPLGLLAWGLSLWRR